MAKPSFSMSLSEFVYTVLLKPPLFRSAANAVLLKILPATLNVQGAKICLNPRDPVISGALTLGLYEKEDIAFFQKHFRPEMTLVDVGANVGLYTALALSRKGFCGRVISLEPDPDSRHWLEATVKANAPKGDSSLILGVAASDQAGEAAFFRNPENGGDNRLYADPLLVPNGMVRTETLDNLCQQNNVTRIDFLKIDVQGAEGSVLRGAREIISASPNLILMTEFWPEGLLKCGTDPVAYLTLLESLGFQLFTSGGKAITPDNRAEFIAKTSGRKYTNLFGFRRQP